MAKSGGEIDTSWMAPSMFYHNYFKLLYSLESLVRFT